MVSGKRGYPVSEVAKPLFLGPELTFTGEEQGLPVPLGSPGDKVQWVPRGCGEHIYLNGLKKNKTGVKKTFVKI